MSITLSQTTNSILSEYAATNTTFSRVVTNVNGILTPELVASITYSRTDYVLDSTGNKVGVVSTNSYPGTVYDPKYTGNISLDSTKFTTYFGAMGVATEALSDQVSAIQDTLIHADLVSRGIIAV